MNNFKVTIISQENYDKSKITEKLLEYFDKEAFDFKDKTVLLKPSFILPIKDEKLRFATNTNNAVIVAVIHALSTKGASKIFIAENGTIGPARYTFYMANIKKDIKGLKNVILCYLDEVKLVTVDNECSFIPEYEVKYPKLLLDGSIDYFISLPKVKTNLFAGISLSVKNNIGLISKKERLKYHDASLHKHLASLTLIRKPDLVIADGIFAGEGQGPQYNSPVGTGMLIVGNNCVAVDAVCCYLMGHDPYEIEHLQLLHEKGIGPLDVDKIEIENREHLESAKMGFKRPDSNLELGSNIQVFRGKEVCQGGCLGMLRGILDTYGLVNGWDSLGNLTLIVGKDVQIPGEKLENLDKSHTIIYGDCAKQYKKYGIFFKGCPPEYFKSLLRLWIGGPLGANPLLKYSSIPKFEKACIIHFFQKLFKF